MIIEELIRRITQYLGSGGLVNPELMNHKMVRDLLIDCRAKFWEISEKKEHVGDPITGDATKPLGICDLSSTLHNRQINCLHWGSYVPGTRQNFYYTAPNETDPYKKFVWGLAGSPCLLAKLFGGEFCGKCPSCRARAVSEVENNT